MRVRFDVIQLVRSVKENRREVVYTSGSERIARLWYNDYVRDHPGEYFELIRIESSEVCLEFTTKRTTPAAPNVAASGMM